MRLYDVVVAFNATDSLAGNNEISPAEQWAIYKFRKEAKTHCDFYAERESVIREKYLEYADETGKLQGEKMEEYVKEYNELNNLEVELNCKKEKLHIVNGIDFTVIEKLDKFFEFVV